MQVMLQKIRIKPRIILYKCSSIHLFAKWNMNLAVLVFQVFMQKNLSKIYFAFLSKKWYNEFIINEGDDWYVSAFRFRKIGLFPF